ncbi:nucleotide disphospho-sugar-binding domain-containing protein [Streptomyces rishiriensis]|uniref:nucleotide disphospho-sugar-binding domain-containing protein n=1 Tax=Streptomyces rishiriensis TaxID=68264 RepID=UPI0037D71E64
MRLLVTALAPSHLLCMVPTAWAARAAGHEVLVVGRAEVARAARRAGLPAAELTQAPAAAGTGADTGPAGVPAGGPDPGLPRMERVLTEAQRQSFAGRVWPAGGHPWQVRVGRVVDAFLAVARQWRPDLILCDPIEFTGLVVGAVTGVPVVVQRWGGPDSMSAEAITRARVVLAEAAAALGAADEIPAPVLTVDPCPPSLRLDTSTEVESVRFVPYNGPQQLPSWARTKPPWPRVCVTFGLFGSKAAMSGADFIEGGDLAARFDAVVEALRPRADLDVVLTVPEAVQPLLRPVPDRFRIVAHAPLDALLATCDAVVHHGGTGTAMTACARGVPQLLLPPPHPALADCAAGLVGRGVGRALEGAAQTDHLALRSALDALLGEGEGEDADAATSADAGTSADADTRVYAGTRAGAGADHAVAGAGRSGCRGHARALAEEIAAQPSPADLVPLLADLA